MAWGLGPRAPHTCLSSSSSHVPFALSASWLICGSLSRYWSQIKGTVSVVSTASWSILNGAGSCGLGSFLPAPRGSRSSSLWIRGLPWWLRGDESTSQCRRCRFRPWVREMPWRRKAGPAEKESGSPGEGSTPTPVLLPGKSHGQRSLVGCGPWGHKESDTT